MTSRNRYGDLPVPVVTLLDVALLRFAELVRERERSAGYAAG